MEDIFFFQNNTKNQKLRCLKTYSYFRLRFFLIFFWHLFIDFALRDFCTFKKLSPSVCIFNLTSTSGKISVIICLQVNNIFHFPGNLNYYHLPVQYLFPLPENLIPLLGNLNCYLLPGILPFSTSGELISTSWEISIITFYQVNTLFPLQGELVSTSWEISIITFYQVKTIFHFRGTHFHFLGNLNYYLLPGKYHFLTSGELASTSWEISISTLYQISTFFHFQGNFIFPLLGNDI